MSDSPTPSPPVRRVTWLVATRGDVLLLGPLFMELRRAQQQPPASSLHWLIDTAETGMAVHQARDLIGLAPDETGELCHPADEPAIRLALMLERAESFIRRRKGTHAIFSGFGPTAAAAAIYCHARGSRGLWLRPPDPAAVAARLRWESGLERLIRACAPCVEVWQIPAVPDWRALAPPAPPPNLAREVPGLRPGAPIVLIAVLRREWGYVNDATERLARGAGAWAAARPNADFLVISNLNARLEGPLRAIPNRPANLVLAPPLPWPVYAAALARARLVLTDSPLVAAEALARAVPVATLGDLPPVAPAGAADWPRALVPENLDSEEWAGQVCAALDFCWGVPPSGGASNSNEFADIQASMRQAIGRFLELG